jgi:hypothetical protein
LADEKGDEKSEENDQDEENSKMKKIWKIGLSFMCEI